jgi:hypothetical protein
MNWKTNVVGSLALMCVATLVSCGGLTVSASCRQRINDCARLCPANTVDTRSDRGFETVADTRTACERRCQEICYL